MQGPALDMPASTQAADTAEPAQARWHKGVVGLLASRLRIRPPPVFAFAAETDGRLKGSGARSGLLRDADRSTAPSGLIERSAGTRPRGASIASGTSRNSAGFEAVARDALTPSDLEQRSRPTASWSRANDVDFAGGDPQPGVGPGIPRPRFGTASP
jgi:hypothetical protein